MLLSFLSPVLLSQPSVRYDSDACMPTKSVLSTDDYLSQRALFQIHKYFTCDLLVLA